MDVVILSEPCKDLDTNSWTTDTTEKLPYAFQERMPTLGDGFIWAKIDAIYVYSCYAPPSLSITDFEELLDRLVNDALDPKPTVIAGDFNAWGCRETNRRGRALLKAFTALDVVLVNSGNKPTFCR